MTQAHPKPALVEITSLPQYPLDKNERLESHWFINFHFNRWLNSKFRLTAKPEVRAYAFDLFCIAQNQIPVGTLPDDDRQLAALLGLDLGAWQDMRALEMPPLYNWSPCACGDEVRLMHPTVTEVALDAFSKKKKNASNLAAGRERRRMNTLRETMVKLGAKHMVKDPSVVLRVKAWLTEQCDGNWTEDWVRQALEAVTLQTV